MFEKILNFIFPDQTQRVVPTKRQKLFHEEVESELQELLPDGTSKTPVEPKRLARALKNLAKDPLSDFDAKRK